MMRLSSGRVIGGFELCLTRPMRSERSPTRPINIAEQRRSFAPTERDGVIPNDEPTEKSAESVSKSSARGGISGARINIAAAKSA